MNSEPLVQSFPHLNQSPLTSEEYIRVHRMTVKAKLHLLMSAFRYHVGRLLTGIPLRLGLWGKSPHRPSVDESPSMWVQGLIGGGFYHCDYSYQGGSWGFDIWARDRDEAEQRLAAIGANGQVAGRSLPHPFMKKRPKPSTVTNARRLTFIRIMKKQKSGGKCKPVR